MSWLPASYGRDPGEIAAAYQVPVHSPPHVTPLRNQWLDAIKQIAPQIADYIQRKKSDEIANQLLQLEHAPAELQGKGQLGLHGAQLFQQYQQDQQANTPDTAMDDLQYQHLYRQTHPEEFPKGAPAGKYPVTMPDGSIVYVTGNAAVRHSDSEQNPKGKERRYMGMNRAETDAPNFVRFYDASSGGNKIDTATADKNASTTFAESPYWNNRVPYEPYKSGVGAFRAEQDRMKARVSTTNLPPEGVSGAVSRPPDQGSSQTTSGGQVGYIPGRKYGGKQYLGGNPKDPNSWR